MSANDKDKDFAPINVEINDRIPRATQRQSNSGSTAAPSKAGQSVAIIALIIAAVSCGAGAYIYTLYQDSQTIIAANEKRLQALEDRLSATGEEMGNSTVALQVKVGELSTRAEELWEQMDKLWASAWRRNQQEIKTLSANLKDLQNDANKLVKEVDDKTKANSSSLASMQSRVDGINTKLNAQANDILAVNVKQDEFEQSNGANSSSMREMSEKLILLERRNTNLLQQIQTLESKLDELAKKSV
jgi:chromosome segregation ATPase